MCMSPTRNGSTVLRSFEDVIAIEIRKRIMINFCPGHPQVYVLTTCEYGTVGTGFNCVV